jgi:hypothetical protein
MMMMSVSWCGGGLKEVLVSTRNCLWLVCKGSPIIALKAVWEGLRTTDEVILMATDLDIDVLHVINKVEHRGHF